jgi:hypothetical protein
MGLGRFCFSLKAGILNYPQQTNKQTKANTLSLSCEEDAQVFRF